jgi:hypothetical protein
MIALRGSDILTSEGAFCLNFKKSNGGMIVSIPCKFERSILSHEEYEAIRLTHHPAIYDVEVAELKAMRSRLRKMRDQERTLGRQRR